MNLLIIYYYPGQVSSMRLAIRRHLTAMEYSSYQFNITYYNAIENAPSLDMSAEDINPSIPNQLRSKKFDVILLHTTFLGRRWMGEYFYKIMKQFSWVQKYDALKIAFPQDPYDHSEILDEWLFGWDVDIIFSVFPKSFDEVFYPLSSRKSSIQRCLTGYIDTSDSNTLNSFANHQKRKYDIAYRATDLPYWFGSHGQLKKIIGDIVLESTKGKKIRTDISTNQQGTITGSKWLTFLRSSRCVLGCESGSSVLDYRGEIQAQIKAIIKNQSEISFQDVDMQMPKEWDDYHFFTISPRHLEATETMTCQLLIEGNYDGILKPNLHYLSIKKDFSNLNEVLKMTRNIKITEEIAERSYEEIYLSDRYNLNYFANSITEIIINNT